MPSNNSNSKQQPEVQGLGEPNVEAPNKVELKIETIDNKGKVTILSDTSYRVDY